MGPRTQPLLLALTVIACCCLSQTRQQAPTSAATASLDAAASPTSTLIGALLREQASRQQAAQRGVATTTELSPPNTSSLSSVETRVPSVVAATTTTTTTQQPASNPSTQPAATTTPAATTIVNKPTEQFQYMKPVSAPKCHYNNQIFSIGQKWNDDCLHTCECVQADDRAVSACRPRCPTYKDPPGANCTLLRSKSDECCLDWNCESEAKYAPTAKATVVQTEAGQMNVSTAEIRMPLTRMISQADLIDQSNVPTTTSPPATTAALLAVVKSESVSSPASTTTTTATPTTIKPTATPSATISVRQSTTAQQQQDSPVQPRIMNNGANSRQAINRQQQFPTTTLQSVTSTAPPPTTTISPRQQPSKPKSLASGSTAAITAVNSRAPKQVQPSGAERSQPQILATQSPSSLPPQRPQSLVTTISSQLDGVDQPQQSSSSRTSRLYPVATAPQTTTDSAINQEQPIDEVDPSLMDLCIQGEDKGFKLYDVWQVEPCNQTCRCVFVNEPRDPLTDVSFHRSLNMKTNSMPTEIRCSLPPHCQSVMSKLNPSAECPQPRLLLPQQQHSFDKCACPQVSCFNQATSRQNNAVTERLQTTTTTTESPIKGCSRPQGGQMLAFGETFNDECHSICRCSPNGEIKCAPLTCPSEPPADVLCAEWTVESNFKPNSEENKCCPQFVCKKPAIEVSPSSTTTISTEPNAVTTSSVTKAANLAESTLKSCVLLGKEMPHGERVPEEMQQRGDNPCEKACVCSDGKIVCQPSCPPIGDVPPDDLDCPPNSAYLIQDECCARWACQIKETFELQDFRVNLVNATNVEMSFVLPLFAVGQRGTFKLNYTGYPTNQLSRDQLNDQSDSSSPPADARWHQRSNISTNDGVFSSQMIKYFQGQLKPEHKYWFKVFVHFDNQEAPFDGPIEGPLRSVIMPPAAPQEGRDELIELSTSTTMPSVTTTVASSTTKVPTILLQPMVSAASTSPPYKNLNSVVQQQPSSTTAGSSSMPPTTTTRAPPSPPPTPAQPSTTQATLEPESFTPEVLKKDISTLDSASKPVSNHVQPCQHIDIMESQPWTESFHLHMNGPFIQRHAWYLLVALSCMTILFLIVSFLYYKKSHVKVPITSHQSAYDNPTFTKLVSYYANQPHVLLVDENNQNFNNSMILAEQKNLEVDKSSPLNQHHHHQNTKSNGKNNHHHLPAHMQHQINDIHHHNGRQHLI